MKPSYKQQKTACAAADALCFFSFFPKNEIPLIASFCDLCLSSQTQIIGNQGLFLCALNI